MRWGLPKVWKLYQHMLEIGERLNPICLRALHQGVYNGACLGTFRRIAKQPVLSSQGKGPDCVFSKVIGDRNLDLIQESAELLLLVYAVAYGFLKLTSFFWMYRIQPCKILLQER